MTVIYERARCSRLMRGGPPNPIARPMRTTSDGRAPTTSAIRSTGTSGQLRQTNACNRSGKCGDETGKGACPLGKSATAGPGDLAAARPGTGDDIAPSASPPVSTELVLINPRRDRSVVNFWLRIIETVLARRETGRKGRSRL